MFNKKNYEYDCTRRCRLRSHGNKITLALTKRSISDKKLACYLEKSCCNFCDIVDDLGRSAVHLAASVGRYAILEWLINQGAIISGRDFESGSSALHRAIYYGCVDCAVLLLRYGANLEGLDEDTRTPLQNVCRLRDYLTREPVTANNEILVWGSNKNYNLGIGNEEGPSTPSAVDFFRKEHISIEKVALGAYHSLFLDRRSYLYVVGHGKGGRLGIGMDNSLPLPKRVKVPIKNGSESIVCLSVSRNHSLILTDRSSVFACGLNEDNQLGVRNAGEKLQVFKEVVTLRDNNVQNLVRVIAKDYHSIAYSPNSIYVWGTNNGQWCLEENAKTVPLPKLMKLPARTTINFVEANNCATCVYTRDNILLLYYNSKMRSLKTPNFESLKSVSVVGGDTIKSAKGSAAALKLLMLTQTNVVFLWYEKSQNFYRCILNNIRLSQIDKILYQANEVLIMSQGDVYKGKCHQVPVPAYDLHKRPIDSNNVWSNCEQQNRTEISKEHMIRIDLQRIQNVDRAVDIFADDSFSSFAVLQESCMKYFKLPTLKAEEYTFKKLLTDAHEGDAVHDLVFHVESQTFAAHKLIVYARSPGLKDIVSGYNDKDIYLNFIGLTEKMFDLVLRYIYGNYLPNESDLKDIQQSLGPEAPKGLAGVCQQFLIFAEKFKLKDLVSYLKSHLEKPEFFLPIVPDKSKYRMARLHRSDFSELYDVRIVCSGDIELQAHKCILVSRLEYFDMMFTHSWSERTTINLNTVPVEYMQAIVDFLYSRDVDHFRKQNYSETYLYNMVVYCDQFFIERLRNVCEILILDKISIRKCGDMLDFACMYNCDILKGGCLDFICQNLARVLSYGCLSHCESETVKCINEHYRRTFKDVFDYRQITPDSEAVDDDLLLSFVDDFEVDLDYRMDEQELEAHKSHEKQKKKENKTRQYEREAISSMMQSMSLDEQSKSVTEQQSKAVKEAQEIAEKLQAEAKSWTRVLDKKEEKKRQSLDCAVKVNETLQAESKPKPELVPLSSTPLMAKGKTPEREMPAATLESDITSPPKMYSLNWSDFTPSREKMSQKQRKRLTSESSSSSPAQVRSPFALAESTPKPAPLPNAWGVTPQSPPAFTDITPPTGSLGDPTSFANMIRSRKVSTSASSANASASPSSVNDQSFSKILADERKQREYFDRMRNKSLVLTQIEETAIAELRDFYNVDNVTDETITIERKSMPRTMNFAVWHRN